MDTEQAVTVSMKTTPENALQLVTMKPGSYYAFPVFWFWVLLASVFSMGFLCAVLVSFIPLPH